jgi:hypothetical protein
MMLKRQVKSEVGPIGRSPVEIKIALMERGWSIKELGRRLRPHRPRSSVSVAIHNPRRYPKLRQAIERALWT